MCACPSDLPCHSIVGAPLHVVKLACNAPSPVLTWTLRRSWHSQQCSWSAPTRLCSNVLHRAFPLQASIPARSSANCYCYRYIQSLLWLQFTTSTATNDQLYTHARAIIFIGADLQHPCCEPQPTPDSMASILPAAAHYSHTPDLLPLLIRAANTTVNNATTASGAASTAATRPAFYKAVGISLSLIHI